MTNDTRDANELRRELMRKRLAERGLAGAKPLEQKRIRAGERYPLSTGQRRMWFLQNLDPSDTTLNICIAYQVSGPLDEQRLRGAFTDVVARHSILRTSYGVDAQGEPYQMTQENTEISWRTCSLIAISAAERDPRIHALARDEFGTPFDLARDAPLRVTLARTAPEEAVLLLVAHHICWDDDSTAVFLSEWSAAYNGRKLGTPAPDFVVVGVLNGPGEPTDSDVEYWREVLRPLPEPLLLPGSSAVPSSRRADRRTRVLSAELWSRIEAFAQDRSASPFIVLLAAFGVLTRRYTGSTDFLISVPVTERSGTAEGALGYFGNTLLLRIAPGPEDTFASFVDAVRETSLAGFAHQSVGIDRVVREANPQRTVGRDGMEHLVALGFSMRKTATELKLNDVTVRQLELGAATAQLPLSLAVVRNPDVTELELEYQTDVLSDELVDQLLSSFTHLLDHALSEPDRRLTALELLGAGGRAAVLRQSQGELTAAAATTMVAVLESAAASEEIAVVSDDHQLTYADLHKRANRLARRLVEQGIGAEDVVGLRMTTSIEFIVAVLAVLKAGAGYLPIDPAYPDDRVEYLISDACPKLVMGRDDLEEAERLAASKSDAALTDAERVRPLRPENVAYVIYTSGSTGTPKGVAVPHDAIAEHVVGFAAEWDMTAQDRLLQSSSVSFDASLLDIFVTLSLGARLVVPKPDAFADIPYVADLIGRHEVTVLHMVPSMLSTLLSLPQIREWRQLRLVPVGGEALPGEVADRFADYFDAQLRNHYGPTEAVVCSTHKPVQGPQGGAVVPIGAPNRDVYAYVLDEELQPVPTGVVGELYLGGNQLARGYLRRPGLTAQRFIADPFIPGRRLYRSGDLVRRNLSGELEFVGRADEQVKVRGYRIELGEVEAVIAGHPAVRHCVVLAQETEAGPTLAAYVVPAVGEKPATALDLEDLRAHAAAVLPDYTVPAAYAVIPEVPLTVSGKLDKRALPAATRVAAGGYREPATVTERGVCAIFGRLFGGESVGADDSFFALGGHSLLAARLVALIRAEFDVELNVRAVFDTPTPAGLAARLTRESAAPRRPALAAAIRPEKPPLSYSQLAMWFQHRLRGPNDVFNLALSLRISGLLDVDALSAAINDVVTRHEALRTTFAESGGVPYQLVHPSMPVELTVAQSTADDADDKVAELRRHLFPLESGPLIRPTLLVIEPDSHVLLLLVHHIVTDHTSLGVIFDDLVVAYRARTEGRPPQWDDVAMQFVDYAVWQRSAFDACSEWGQSELAYWAGALAGLPDEITMAADHSRPPVLGTRAEVTTFPVSAAGRAELAAFAEQIGASEFMVYQAALAVLLHKLGGGADVPIGSPVAARNELSTAKSNGPFANVVVLRNDLSGDPSLRDAVVRSRDVVLDALAHQELPIDRLVEALNPRRSTSRNHPLFQSSIHFRGDDWALEPRDLTAETSVVPVSLGFEVSLLDLNVGMDVTADGGLDVRIVANADLYGPETVRHLGDALAAALQAFATTPDAALSTVQLLPAEVMERLLAPPTASPVEAPQPITGGSVETERALIALLEELLEITDVERDDNFFALGGDSIIAVQLSARATAQGLALTPLMVFEHMTVAELAGAVDAGMGQLAAETDSPTTVDAEPVNASGLDAGSLAALTVSWQNQT